MIGEGNCRPIEILLVEDSPGDVRLTQEALKEAKVRNNLSVARDGEEALAVLRQQGPHAGAARPDLILLDLNLPQKDGFVYAAGTERGDEIQNAVDEARLIAVGVLGQQLETEMNGVVARAQEEINDKGAIDNFKNTQESIYSVNVSDYKIAKQEIVNDKKLYRAYVLIEYDMNAAQQKLLSKIKADQVLYEAMRATELFDEMEKKVEAYRKRNKS